MKLHGTSSINEQGHLTIGGVDTVELAKTYATPLYVVDETYVREQCREYMAAFKSTGLKYQVAYASKAFCVKAICRIVEEEGLALDVVSEGELYTALEAGFPAHKIHFHGNNKSPDEIEYALSVGIGCFVVDNIDELNMLRYYASKLQTTRQVNVLLRITPGVEAHTHEFISTGQTDSKFGFDLQNGSAFAAVEEAHQSEHLHLLGVHSHIGSQIFEVDGFTLAVDKIAAFAKEVRQRLDITFEVINLGGGFGIRYTNDDQPLPISSYVQAIAERVKTLFEEMQYKMPAIWIEPGRSIIGEAGTTLYTVGTTKEIPGVRKYVAVDGGMTDNPRPALYDAKYDAILANRAHEPNTECVSIAGKCCESGDMLIWDTQLPKANQGDVLAVFSTGAYNYAMASNYNRLRRPAVVFVQNGEADIAVRRETLEQLVQNDVIPERLVKKQRAESFATE